MNSKTAVSILKKLDELYPHTDSEMNFLRFNSPYELLIMTILSAQTTDVCINKLRDELFETYPNPKSLACADILEVEKIIHPTGFYHAKAKNITACSKLLCENFGGEVPNSIEELITLPGVGRKTANIVTNHAFGNCKGIAVDTHVGRLSQRIGFTENSDPLKIEQDLLGVFPEKYWKEVNYLLIRHGREICTARKPNCESCIVSKHCKYYQEQKQTESS